MHHCVKYKGRTWRRWIIEDHDLQPCSETIKVHDKSPSMIRRCLSIIYKCYKERILYNRKDNKKG